MGVDCLFLLQREFPTQGLNPSLLHRRQILYHLSYREVMWELDYKESWAIKNWCFWTVVLEKTFESPLECKEINPEYSLEGLTLKLQYFGHLMGRTNSLEKSLMLGKIKGRRRRGRQRMRWLDSITVAINMNLGKCFPDGSDGKASVCNAGDPGLIPGLGRSPGEGNGSPLQYSCLENPMDGGAW